MKVTANSRQYDISGYHRSSRSTSARTRSAERSEGSSSEASSDIREIPEEFDLTSSSIWERSASQAKDAKSDKCNMSSSNSEPSVGELAALLARAEDRFEVHQVSAKAMRALVELKMTAAASDGDEAKKIARKIRRMEKLLKQVQKKLKHLAKEEQMELQRKRAEKKQELEKEQKLREEIQSRRKKRRREERRYAAKELSEDQKESNSQISDAFYDIRDAGAITPELSESIDLSGGDIPSFDGGSIDIMA